MEDINSLEDDQIQDIVEKLREELKQKTESLKILQDEISGIQATVEIRKMERHNFADHVLQVEEISPLIEVTNKLKESLKVKQRHLEELRSGTAAEVKELELLKKQLQELKESTAVSMDHSGSTAVSVDHSGSIEELERACIERKRMCEHTRDQIRKAQEAVSALEVQYHSKKTKSLDQKVDSFLKQCCKEAGLQL